MRADGAPHLLPGRLDDLARRFAPAWAADALEPGPAAGTGLRLLQPLLWVLVAATVVQSVLHVVDVVAFDLRVTRISASEDFSLDGWLGTGTTLLAAWGALQLALLAPRVRAPLLLLAALCAYLSIDDMLTLHELVARQAPRLPLYRHSGYDLWPAVYLPMLVLIGWLMLRTARSIDVRAGRLLVTGLACLATAVLLETLVPVLLALGFEHGQPLYESEVVVEEALELMGWGFMAVGLSAAAVDRLLARSGALVRPSGSGADHHGEHPVDRQQPAGGVPRP